MVDQTALGDPITAIVGAGGLLGSATTVAVSKNHQTLSTAGLAWRDLDRLRHQFRALVDSLAQIRDTRPWIIYWCAGAGYVSAADAVHRHDQQVLALLLDELRANPPQGPGCLAFASSAGAVYAGNRSWPANESTQVAAIHGYGESKLAQERTIATAVAGLPNTRAVFLRISNLYGLGQTIGKPQGLLSHLVVNTFRREPSMIYVPLDTSRDYLFSTDAAQMAQRAALLSFSEHAGSTRIRVLAAEQNHTIAQVMATLSRIMKRRVPFSARSTADTDRQPAILSFRSLDPSQRSLARVSLEEGIARIVAEYAQNPGSNKRAHV